MAGEKVSETTKAQVMGYLSEGNSYRKASQKYGVSPAFISKLVKNNEKFVKLCEQKQKQIQQDVVDFMSSEGIIQTMSNMLAFVNNPKSTKILEARPDLAIRVFGTLADKVFRGEQLRLDRGKSLNDNNNVPIPTIINDAGDNNADN